MQASQVGANMRRALTPSKFQWKQKIILMILFAALILGYMFLFTPRTTFVGTAPIGNVKTAAELTDGMTLTQEIDGGGEVLKGIGVGFDTFYRRNTAEYTISVADGAGNVLGSSTFNADKVPEEGVFYVPMPDVPLQQAERYTISITSKGATPGNALGIKLNEAQSAVGCSINGKAQSGGLLMDLGYESFSAGIVCATLILVALVCVAILFWSDKLHINVLLLALIFGVLFALFTPILDTPDEQQHAASAILMSTGQFVVPSVSGGELPNVWIPINNNTYATLFNNTLGGLAVDGGTFHNVWGAGQIFIGYLPQMIGLWFAKLFAFDAMGFFYAGRVANAVFYAICACIAVKTAPRFKIYLAAIALMPMAFYVVGSYNSDGYTYGLALILGALFLRMFFERERKIGWRDVLVFLLVCALLVMKKYNLALLAFLPMLVPAARFESRKIKWIGCALILIASAVAAVALMQASVALNADPNATSALQAGGMNDRGASMGGQIAFMLGNPAATVSIFSKNILHNLGGNLQQMFVLGQYMTYQVDTIFIFAYFAFLAVVGFAYARYEPDTQITPGWQRVSLWNRFFVAVILLGSVVLTYLMLYLSWTPVGSDAILGVQGRYFVPLFFLLPMLGQNVSPVIGREARERSAYHILFVAALFAALTLMSILFQNY